MSWRSIDFHGITALDRRIVGQLNQYLQEKEARLANQIFNMIQPLPNEPFAPVLHDAPKHLKLSEAVEGFTKKLRTLSDKDLNYISAENRAQVIREINKALWELTEVLEGCVIELFQQVKQVNIDRWHISLAQVVQSIKDMLSHRIEDLIWTIRRLEGPLKNYFHKYETNKWNRWIGNWRAQLDPNLLSHLSQSEKLLKSNYEDFQERYSEYLRLNIKVEDVLQKMKTYPILALLEIEDQNLYVDIFRLLKLYELNPRSKSVLALETVRSLKNLCSVDAAINIFRTYYHELRDAFFNSSLELKALTRESQNPQENAKRLQVKVKEYENELQELLLTMSQYRKFMLNTSSNPYVSSRWGFTEWIVGPEPAKSRHLLGLIYLGEELNAWYMQFLSSLSKDPLSQQRKEHEAHQEIEKLLHEMGQPLISRSMMQNRIQRLLDQIKNCDEVGSPYPETINYVEGILSKAMREDWKYHVLHEFPLFREIYYQHQGLHKNLEDPSHAFRMERLHQLFDQIEDWVRREDVYSHVHEIELDINDMKTYLQDFLAAVQRTSKDKSSNPFLDETIEKFRQELLEYRYIFGRFFFNIMTKDIDGQQLRNQFLFVDQYFESVELLLQDLTASWQGKDSWQGKEHS